MLSLVAGVFTSQSDGPTVPPIPVFRGKGLFLLRLLGESPSLRAVRVGTQEI